MSERSVSAALLLALVLVGATGVVYVGGVAAQSSEYSIRAETTIDIPERTTTVEGTEYTVSSIGRVTAGETLNAETSGPDGESYDVSLYDSERRIVNSESDVDGSVSFSTDNLRPGTYILAIYTSNGSLVAPQPVVVAGYETTVNAPSEISAGESNEVTVELDDVADLGSPEDVELVVAQDETLVDTIQMDQESASEYTAEIGSSLESGEYQVYANVRGESTTDGDNEVVGVSDAQTVSVSDEQSQSGGGDSGDGSTGGVADEDESGAGDDGANADETPTEAGTETAESASPSTATEEVTTTAQSTETTTTEETTEVATSEVPSETTEASAETSTPQTEAAGNGETESTMPNYALYVVALALIAVALVSRR